MSSSRQCLLLVDNYDLACSIYLYIHAILPPAKYNNNNNNRLNFPIETVFASMNNKYRPNLTRLRLRLKCRPHIRLFSGFYRVSCTIRRLVIVFNLIYIYILNVLLLLLYLVRDTLFLFLCLRRVFSYTRAALLALY